MLRRLQLVCAACGNIPAPTIQRPPATHSKPMVRSFAKSTAGGPQQNRHSVQQRPIPLRMAVLQAIQQWREGKACLRRSNPAAISEQMSRQWELATTISQHGRFNIRYLSLHSFRKPAPPVTLVKTQPLEPCLPIHAHKMPTDPLSISAPRHLPTAPVVVCPGRSPDLRTIF